MAAIAPLVGPEMFPGDSRSSSGHRLDMSLPSSSYQQLHQAPSQTRNNHPDIHRTSYNSNNNDNRCQVFYTKASPGQEPVRQGCDSRLNPGPPEMSAPPTDQQLKVQWSGREFRCRSFDSLGSQSQYSDQSQTSGSYEMLDQYSSYYSNHQHHHQHLRQSTFHQEAEHYYGPTNNNISPTYQGIPADLGNCIYSSPSIADHYNQIYHNQGSSQAQPVWTQSYADSKDHRLNNNQYQANHQTLSQNSNHHHPSYRQLSSAYSNYTDVTTGHNQQLEFHQQQQYSFFPTTTTTNNNNNHDNQQNHNHYGNQLIEAHGEYSRNGTNRLASHQPVYFSSNLDHSQQRVGYGNGGPCKEAIIGTDQADLNEWTQVNLDLQSQVAREGSSQTADKVQSLTNHNKAPVDDNNYPISQKDGRFDKTKNGVSILPKPSVCIQKSTSEAASHIAASQRSNQCGICGRNYARPSTLKTHLRTHTNERPFKCNVCHKTFSQAANLTAHQRVHTGERPFSCPVCGRQFSQSSSVITHLRTHSGERPYRCTKCSRTFSDSSTLTKHCRIHSGEKPYQCDYCPLNFSQSGNLSRHLKLHLMGSTSSSSSSCSTRSSAHSTSSSSSFSSSSSSSSTSSNPSTCSISPQNHIRTQCRQTAPGSVQGGSFPRLHVDGSTQLTSSSIAIDNDAKSLIRSNVDKSDDLTVSHDLGQNYGQDFHDEVTTVLNPPIVATIHHRP